MTWIRDHTMNLILLILFVVVLVFTVIMIWLYILTGGIPDTLCTCFFAAATGECGFMGWIKTAKIKHVERQWKLDDKVEEDRATELRKNETIQALKEQEGAYDSTRSEE